MLISLVCRGPALHSKFRAERTGGGYKYISGRHTAQGEIAIGDAEQKVQSTIHTGKVYQGKELICTADKI
jgi:hypothetical protein